MADVNLAEHELAALDFLIAAKKAGIMPLGFIGDIVNVINNIADVAKAIAPAVVAVTAVAGGAAAAIATASTRGSVASGEGLTLETLMQARELAVKS